MRTVLVKIQLLLWIVAFAACTDDLSRLSLNTHGGVSGSWGSVEATDLGALSGAVSYSGGASYSGFRVASSTERAILVGGLQSGGVFRAFGRAYVPESEAGDGWVQAGAGFAYLDSGGTGFSLFAAALGESGGFGFFSDGATLAGTRSSAFDPGGNSWATALASITSVVPSASLPINGDLASAAMNAAGIPVLSYIDANGDLRVQTQANGAWAPASAALLSFQAVSTQLLNDGYGTTVLWRGQAAVTSALAAGRAHSCLLVQDGRVRCWGRNDEGQVGDATTTDRFVPVDVSGLNVSSGAQATAIVSGDAHACAIVNTSSATGAVRCWGRNDSGQLGNGAAGTDSSSPVNVTGLDGLAAATRAVAIAAGGNHSCAVTAAGALMCWGENAFGQVGDASTTDRSTPVAVALSGGATPASVELGGEHSCAVTAAGAVQCWGRNDSGQVGDGTTTDRTSPVVIALSGAVNASRVALGGEHSCAITVAGAVQCWGANFSGELGDGTLQTRLSPVVTSGLGGVTVSQLMAGGDLRFGFTCAITTSGELKCWGSGRLGQLGDGALAGSRAPQTVTAFSGTTVSAMASGFAHACALLDGQVWCWGLNDYGQLGGGGAPAVFTGSTPDLAFGADGAVLDDVAAGSDHVCFSGTSGGTAETFCSGRNDRGQLGDATGVPGNSRASLESMPGFSGFSLSKMISGGDQSCALTSSGGLFCWGANGLAQLGNGAIGDSSSPVVSGSMRGKTIDAASAGGDHTCAIVNEASSLRMECWGDNGVGQLGDGTTTDRLSPSPIEMSGLSVDSSATPPLAAGGLSTCMVASGGTLVCWGRNASGQLGNGLTSNSSLPVGVQGFDGDSAEVEGVALGESHACAMYDDTGVIGAVKCWGDNTYYQSGNGLTSGAGFAAQYTTPGLVVSGLDGTGALGLTATNATAITAGKRHACAITGAGTVKCWGFNSEGQLGDASTTNRETPVTPATAGVPSVIAAGDYHTCMMNAAGAIQCWGRNNEGQLGDGTTTDRTAPTAVAGLGGTATALAAGGNTTCALVDVAGTITAKCWGHNGFGQVGDGTTTNRSSPTNVTGLTGVTPAQILVGGRTTLSGAVTTNSGHACLISTTGGMRCWGGGASGQLGDGDSDDETAAVTPQTLEGAVALTAPATLYPAVGNEHSCHVVSDNGTQKLRCVGSNGNGQLGDGTNTDQTSFVAIASYNNVNVDALGAGGAHTCAAKNGAEVECWGANTYGQLGDGTNTDRNAPVDALGLGGAGTLLTVTGLAHGKAHSCALQGGSNVYCWGLNRYGQLGDGSVADSVFPVDTGINTATAVVSGDWHSCALLADQSVRCWGNNSFGQLGDGTTTDRTTPTAVSVLDGVSVNVVAIAAGRFHSCAVSDIGKAYCWGLGDLGQTALGAFDEGVTQGLPGLVEGADPCPSGRCLYAADSADSYATSSILNTPTTEVKAFSAASDAFANVVSVFVQERATSVTCSTATTPVTTQCNDRVYASVRGASGVWSGPTPLDSAFTAESTTLYQNSVATGGIDYANPGVASLGEGEFLAVFSLTDMGGRESGIYSRLYEVGTGWVSGYETVDVESLSGTTEQYRIANDLKLISNDDGEALLIAHFVTTNGSVAAAREYGYRIYRYRSGQGWAYETEISGDYACSADPAASPDCSNPRPQGALFPSGEGFFVFPAPASSGATDQRLFTVRYR